MHAPARKAKRNSKIVWLRYNYFMTAIFWIQTIREEEYLSFQDTIQIHFLINITTRMEYGLPGRSDGLI